jgi:hypothetical protein
MGKAAAAALARRGDIQVQSVAVLNILCKADSKFFWFCLLRTRLTIQACP